MIRPTLLFIAGVIVIFVGCDARSRQRQESKSSWKPLASQTTFEKGHWKLETKTGKINDIAFSHDSTLIAAAGENNETTVWDLRRKSFQSFSVPKVLSVATPSHQVVSWKPADPVLVVGTHYEGIRVWEIGPSSREISRLAIVPWAPTSLAFSRDGKALAIGGENWGGFTGFGFASTISVWPWEHVPGTTFDHEKGPRIYELNWERGPVRDAFSVYAVDFSLDGSVMLASGCYHLMCDLYRGQVRYGRALDLDPEQRDKAFARGDFEIKGKALKAFERTNHELPFGIICAWKVASGELVKEIPLLEIAHEHLEVAAKFGSGRHWIFYLAGDLHVISKDTARNTVVDTGVSHITCFDVSVDKEWMAVATSDGKVVVMDTMSLARLHSREAKDEEISAMAVGPNRKMIAVGTNAGTVHVWTL